MDNDNAILNAGLMNSNDNIKNINISVLIQNKDINDYISNNNYNSNDYRLKFLESFTLRFNKIDSITNFWLFSNIYTKQIKYKNNGLNVDISYSL